MRRIPWQLLVAVILLVLLPILATLQYRWLGEVSEAERERMRASLRTRASEFTQEFDGELTRAYAAFQVSGEQLDTDAAAVLVDAYARWQASSKIPALVRAVYLAEGKALDSAGLRRLDSGSSALEAAAWPPELAATFARGHHPLPQVVAAPRGALPPMLFADAVDSRTPALIISVPRVNRTTNAGPMTFITDPASARAVIVTLDAAALQQHVLEPLVARYFGEPAGSEYLVTIARRDEPDTIVYNSGPATVGALNADITMGLFDLRMDSLSRLADGAALGLPATSRVAITIVRRSSGAEGKRVLMAGGDEQGAWQVRVRHRSGSLEAVVAQSRRRNLAISLGVLGLLAASFLLVLASAQRQQRLSRQQMEFVAAVSHELRTPLAVICSAGENLADGVVADAPQVKRYGSLIETEGRRLGDMVERVMAFAGISSGAPFRSRTEIDVARVIAEAVDGVRHDAGDRGVTIAVEVGGNLPSVMGDVGALRSAVQNIVGNAVKYSRDGGAVDVVAASSGTEVQIRIADQGLGIDKDDLPHIFKPFYRGRRAVDAQVRGSGVGLSVVRHVIQAHHGTIHVDSRVGEGTTVTVVLPVGARHPSDEAQPAKAANVV